MSLLEGFFLSYNIPIIEISKGFDCKCQKHHQTFVYFCKRHPYATRILYEKCKCVDRPPGAKCPFCCFVICILNIRAFKICLEELPDFMSYRVVPIENYLAQIKLDPFVWFGEFVRMSLDDPLHIVPIQTD